MLLGFVQPCLRTKGKLYYENCRSVGQAKLNKKLNLVHSWSPVYAPMSLDHVTFAVGRLLFVTVALGRAHDNSISNLTTRTILIHYFTI